MASPAEPCEPLLDKGNSVPAVPQAFSMERSAQRSHHREPRRFRLPVLRTPSGRGYPARVHFRWLRCWRSGGSCSTGSITWATASPKVDRKRPIHSSNESIKGSYSGDRRVKLPMEARLANKQIAYALNIAETTAKNHVKNILHKLGVHDRTHAATAAIQRGIIHL